MWMKVDTGSLDSCVAVFVACCLRICVAVQHVQIILDIQSFTGTDLISFIAENQTMSTC